MLSEQTRNANKVMLTINALVVTFFFAGYIAEYFKGGKTLAFILVFFAILLIPMIVALILYFRDKKSELIKYITLTGHLILYAFVMSTTDSIATFAYCFPIVLMFYQYYNLTLMIISCAGIGIINAAFVTYWLFIKHMTSSDTTSDYTIQLASVILFCYALIVSTRISKRFSLESNAAIQTEQKKQMLILSDVLKIAGIMGRNSHDVQDIVDELAAGAEVISNAVTEINTGVVQTAESIQNQSSMTKNIHNLILDTSELSEKMDSLSTDSSEALDQGVTNVRELSQKASTVSEKSQYAYKKMQELMEKAHEIQNITEVITGISEQTSMLSLNASIEAARAGEHGRGFAVVADEIRKLSMQSKNSAASIEEILKALETKASRTSDAVMTLKDINDQQTHLILNTKQIFDNMANKMTLSNEHVGMIKQRMEDIVSANNRIVDSINEISALSQQAAANTQQAGAITTVTKEKSAQARLLVNELIETSASMDKYR